MVNFVNFFHDQFCLDPHLVVEKSEKKSKKGIEFFLLSKGEWSLEL